MHAWHARSLPMHVRCLAAMEFCWNTILPATMPTLRLSLPTKAPILSSRSSSAGNSQGCRPSRIVRLPCKLSTRYSPTMLCNIVLRSSSIVGAMPCARPGSDLAFYNHGNALPTADTQGCQAIMRLAPLHFIEQGYQDARTAGPDWMAQRNRTTVYVELRCIKTQLSSYRY